MYSFMRHCLCIRFVSSGFETD